MSATNNKQNKRSNALVLAEAVIVTYVAYMANFIVVNILEAEQASSVKLIANIGLLTFLVLVSSLSVGLYEAKLRENLPWHYSKNLPSVSH